MKRILAASSMFAVGAVSSASAAAPYPVREGQPCKKANGHPVLFSVDMGERAARAVYAGVRRVSSRERKMLSRIARCQRNPGATPFVRAYAARTRARWLARRTIPPMSTAIASVYDAAGGSIACGGDRYALGVASRTLACGTRLLICAASCVHAVVFDRGPYVPGRDLDLSRAVQGAIGFPYGVGPVRYAILR